MPESAGLSEAQDVSESCVTEACLFDLHGRLLDQIAAFRTEAREFIFLKHIRVSPPDGALLRIHQTLPIGGAEMQEELEFWQTGAGSRILKLEADGNLRFRLAGNSFELLPPP